jgi:hypothetical protein
VVKKAKKSTTKKRAVKRKATATKKLSARDQQVLERMHATGNGKKALEAMLAINLDIDRTTPAVPFRPGLTAARIGAAKRAFEDAMFRSDDLGDWIAAARKAAQLP